MRLTKMMFIIFATYIISFLPLMIFNVIDEEVGRLAISYKSFFIV